MSPRRQILETLLLSALQPRPVSALDVTSDGSATRAFEARQIPCVRAPRAGALYGVVVCDVRSLSRVQTFVEPLGSAVVFVPTEQAGSIAAAGVDFEAVAHARCPGGAWVRLRRSAQLYTVPPRVSAVVVTRDDAAAMARLACALEDEPTDPAWELVVVDRGSFDATPDVLDQLSGDVRRIRLPRSTDDVHALHVGLSAARGELLVPLDVHLHPSSGFVCSLTAALDSEEARPPGVLLGVVYEADGRTPARAPAPLRLPAIHRTLLTADPTALPELLRSAPAWNAAGFRARRQAPPSARVGLGAESLDHRAQPEAYPVFAKSG